MKWNDKEKDRILKHCAGLINNIIDRLGIINTDYERGRAKIELLGLVARTGDFMPSEKYIKSTMEEKDDEDTEDTKVEGK